MNNKARAPVPSPGRASTLGRGTAPSRPLLRARGPTQITARAPAPSQTPAPVQARPRLQNPTLVQSLQRGQVSNLPETPSPVQTPTSIQPPPRLQTPNRFQIRSLVQTPNPPRIQTPTQTPARLRAPGPVSTPISLQTPGPRFQTPNPAQTLTPFQTPAHLQKPSPVGTLTSIQTPSKPLQTAVPFQIPNAPHTPTPYQFSASQQNPGQFLTPNLSRIPTPFPGLYQTSTLIRGPHLAPPEALAPSTASAAEPTPSSTIPEKLTPESPALPDAASVQKLRKPDGKSAPFSVKLGLPAQPAHPQPTTQLLSSVLVNASASVSGTDSTLTQLTEPTPEPIPTLGPAQAFVQLPKPTSISPASSEHLFLGDRILIKVMYCYSLRYIILRKNLEQLFPNLLDFEEVVASQATGEFEVFVGETLVHSKKRGDGFMDELKLQKVVDAINEVIRKKNLSK